MSEPLLHNANNPVTKQIERIDHGSGTAIRKVLARDDTSAHPDWYSSTDPRSWAYWRREARVYASDLLERLRGTGLSSPELLELQRSDGEVELILEDVSGRTGAALTTDDLCAAVRGLGRLQGSHLHSLPSHDWLSRRFLRTHCASKHVDAELLYAEHSWARDPVTAWTDEIREAIVLLHERRQDLFAALDTLPRTWSHLDFWSRNLIATDDHVVLIDWSVTGEGALGEDVGNLIAELGLADLVSAEALPDLSEQIFAAFAEGLDDAGAGEASDDARRGMYASAVKFHWMGPLLLERAKTGEHRAYGGEVPADPKHQVVQRGETLAFLGEWAARALV